MAFTGDGDIYVGYSYKLRSGGVMPMGSTFLVQTFGVDKNEIKTYSASTILPRTEDMAGADPSGTFISANFTRLAFLKSSGEMVFSGNTVKKPDFLDNHELES